MFSFLLVAASVVAADPLPDGSLLFLENCNKFVELYTANQVGHVAMVLQTTKPLGCTKRLQHKSAG